uniref:sn-1-specific diacylglycerol lipase ABHD11 n=1 Tax=Lygus hesperus TaxID=30085 RepID=A0A0K8SHQ9_LYGHE
MLLKAYTFCNFGRSCAQVRKLHLPTSLCNGRSNLSMETGPVIMSSNEYGVSSSSIDYPVLIMHGVLGSKNNWNSLAKALNKDTKRKVIALDARNHGDSPHTAEFSYDLMAMDVIYLMDQRKFNKACLIGHSMGGRAMMRVALSYPERVEKLIVVDISPIQISATLVIEKYLDLFENLTIDDNLPLSQGRRLADQLMNEYVPELDIRQFLLSNLTKVNGKFRWKANITSLKNSFENIVKFPLTTEVYNNPVLFVGGTKSDYLKVEDQDRILKYFPRAQFEYLPAGHWVHAEQPVAFLKLSAEFIKSSNE